MENDFIFLKRIRDILFFIFCTCLMLFLSLFIYIDVNAETINMPTPNRALEYYVDNSWVNNTNLPTVNWGSMDGKNVGGVNLLNTTSMQEIHIYYNDIANSGHSYVEFYFNINQVGFTTSEYVPYRVGSAYIETDGNVYTQCSYINYQFYGSYDIRYKYICEMNLPLTNWNIAVFFTRDIDSNPFWSSTDRVRFSIGTGSFGSIVTNATSQDVVNSINNQTNQIIQNNNNNTQQIVSKIDTTHGILRTISSAITNVINAIANLPSLIWNGFSSAFTTLFGWLSDIYDTIQNIFDDDTPTSQYITDYLESFVINSDNIILEFVTLPIQFLTSVISSTSCSVITLGSLFGYNLTLPCLRGIISGILGTDLYNIVVTLVTLMIYWRLCVFVKSNIDKVLELSLDINDTFNINL